MSRPSDDRPGVARRIIRCQTAMAAVALAVAAGGAGEARAHIDVFPTQAAAGAAERFTIRVPSERDLATTEIRVEFPPQILVYSVNPPPGWSARLRMRPDGRARGVVFSGGRIPADQFEEFDVLGTPQEAGEALWKSEQVYADGQVKPWTGPPEEPGEAAPESAPEAPGPSSATTVLVAVEAASDEAVATGDGGGSDDTAALWLGAIAIAIAAAAAVGVGLLWSSRPARLPEDDE